MPRECNFFLNPLRMSQDDAYTLPEMGSPQEPFKMHRLPPDVLNVVTQLLDVKELGRCSRTSCSLAAAAAFGFEARALERGPGLVLHARQAQRQFRREPDWRKLCRKAMSINREHGPAGYHLSREAANPQKGIKEANQKYMFTLEAFDGDPSDSGTTCLLAKRAELGILVTEDPGSREQVSVDAFFPVSIQRDRIAFMRVLISRGADSLEKTAVLYSGAATGEETSTGRARWFHKYKPPWIEFDDDADGSEGDTLSLGEDDEDEIGNGLTALVWNLTANERRGSHRGPGCGAYFKKGIHSDRGETFMPLNEVLFRLEHLLVFD